MLEQTEPEVFETSDEEPVFGFQETEVHSSEKVRGRRLGDAGATKSVPTLIVSNIPKGITVWMLENVFEGDPGFQQMRYVPKLAADEVIVDYSDVRFAAEAMEAHQGHVFHGNSNTGLIIEWDKDKLDESSEVEPIKAFEVFAGNVYQSRSLLPPHHVFPSKHDLDDSQSESSLPTERYFRLRNELEVLERDVKLFSQSNDDITQERPNEVWVAMTTEVQRMQQQLGSLAHDSPLKMLLMSSQKGSSTLSALREKNLRDELSSMIDDLNMKIRLSHTAEPNQSEHPSETYELYCNGRSLLKQSDAAMVRETERVGALERRITCLEKLLGHQATGEFDTTWENILDDGVKGATSLVDKVDCLEQRVALLDQPRVEGCVGALKLLRKELAGFTSERPRDLSGDVIGDDVVMKVNNLYRRTMIIDECGLGSHGDLSSLVARLETLQSVHEQAVHWVNRLTQMEQHQTLTEERCQRDEEILQKLEHSLISNMQTLKSNIAAVDERIRHVSGTDSSN